MQRNDATTLAAATAIAVLAAAGCSPYVTSTPLNDTPDGMTPRAPSTVEMYSSGPPDRPHVDVAILHATCDMPCDPEDPVVGLRGEAARMGCDAVVVTSARSSMADGTCVAYSPDDR